MLIYECSSCQWLGNTPHLGSEQNCKNCEFNFDGKCAGHGNLYGYGEEITDETKVCSVWSESLEYFIERNALANGNKPKRAKKKYIEVCSRCGGKSLVKLYKPTALGEYFGIPRTRINPILSTLGLIQESKEGWVITESGTNMGGKQLVWKAKGHTSLLVCWQENILTFQPLVDCVEEIKAQALKKKKAKATN